MFVMTRAVTWSTGDEDDLFVGRPCPAPEHHHQAEDQGSSQGWHSPHYLSSLRRMFLNCTVIGGPACTCSARTPFFRRFPSQLSVTSTVFAPLIWCINWLPRAMITYSFQSSFLILSWMSSDFPSE